jgi:uncharacterized damage-inducible protein DinB
VKDMNERLSGRPGEVLKFGLGARNWLLMQLQGTDEQFTWTPPEGGRSAKELVDHINLVLISITQHLSETLDLEIEIGEPKEVDGIADQLSEEIQSAFNTYKGFCGNLTDELLDTTTTLPPPIGIREGPIETILRVTAGYHVIHHAGQVAALLRRARNES